VEHCASAGVKPSPSVHSPKRLGRPVSSSQRVDLITHQPFHEYARDVNNVRRRFMEHASRSWMQHYAALSHLSRYILVGFVVVTALIVFTMLLHPASWFTWGDALVLIATFTQSFLVLMVVFGIFHRSDLSFDAVVKFFAVGELRCGGKILCCWILHLRPCGCRV